MRTGQTLYIVRHGETDWNRDRRYQGQCDIPLNVVGRAQALRNGETLRAHLPALATIDFISSPLGRARETMEIVRAALALDPQAYAIDERLKELSYGSWEGQLQDELPRIDPDGWTARQRDPYRWRPSGGESYADLMQRTAAWSSSLVRDTLVAAHGGVMRTVQAFICGLDPDRVPTLDAPQDKVLVLRDGGMTWL